MPTPRDEEAVLSIIEKARAAGDGLDFRTLAKEEFLLSARAFFAPVIGTILMLSLLWRQLSANDE